MVKKREQKKLKTQTQHESFDIKGKCTLLIFTRQLQSLGAISKHRALTDLIHANVGFEDVS